MKLTSYRIVITAACLLITAAAPAFAQTGRVHEYTEIPREEGLDIGWRNARGIALNDKQQQLLDSNRRAYDHNRTLGGTAYKAKDYATAILAYTYLARGGRDFAWELAESHLAAGNRAEALNCYRKAMYQKVALSSSRHTELTTFAKLPVGAASPEDARERFPEEKVDAWADNDPVKLGRFALLLAEAGQYAEAIGAYEKALHRSSGGQSEYAPALTLGNITPDNFDRTRFRAATYAMMAAYGPTSPWMNLTYAEGDGKYLHKESQRERAAWIDEAIRIKPDYAPALYIKADLITRVGDRKSKEEYAAARACLDRAERFARTGELRGLIQKLRTEQSDKLR